MATLIISNGSIANPQSLDLSQYINFTDQSPTDPAAPQYSDKVWSRSVLREGAVLSMEQVTEKELIWDLYLNAANTTALHKLIQQINTIVETPGCVCQFQNDGASQPTYFDGLTGQLDITFSYWKTQSQWTEAKLRFFAQPFGRTASPRRYATASGAGPLLIVSPYASGGALSVAASTQSGVAGFGGRGFYSNSTSASSGVFYWGAPSLAGDAPAQLQISYVGPLPNTATNYGVVPYVAVSLLPDQYYQPLIGPTEVTSLAVTNPGASRTIVTTAPCGAAISYIASPIGGVRADILGFSTIHAASPAVAPGVTWGGLHRLFAIARASAGNMNGPPGMNIWTEPGPGVNGSTVAAVPLNVDWQVLDLGTVSIRPSNPGPYVQLGVALNSASGAIWGDIGGFVMLPDNSTWFLNPTQIQPSQYGFPLPIARNNGNPSAPYTNTLLMDDILGDQLIYTGQSQTFAPSPLGSIPSSARITQYSRGIIPRPDPKMGLPILAILGVGQTNIASSTVSFTYPNGVTASQVFAGASWTSTQALPSYVQVNVLERTRYLLS